MTLEYYYKEIILYKYKINIIIIYIQFIVMVSYSSNQNISFVITYYYCYGLFYLDVWILLYFT